MKNKEAKQVSPHSAFLQNRRGQVTIFIIIAILIVAAVALFFTLRGGVEKEKTLSPEIVPIKNFVDECLEDSLGKVVYRIGEGGGYYFPEAVLSTEILDVPYYIKNNRSYMPSKEKIENEISKYVVKDLTLCLGDFALFPEYEITTGKINAETEILNNSVKIIVNYPLTIKKGEFKKTIKDFEAEVPIRLGIIHSSVSSFLEEELQKEDFCVSCLLDHLVEENLYSSVFNYDDKTTIFIIRDSAFKINDKEFIYTFANEYQ